MERTEFTAGLLRRLPASLSASSSIHSIFMLILPNVCNAWLIHIPVFIGYHSRALLMNRCMSLACRSSSCTELLRQLPPVLRYL